MQRVIQWYAYKPTYSHDLIILHLSNKAPIIHREKFVKEHHYLCLWTSMVIRIKTYCLYDSLNLQTKKSHNVESMNKSDAAEKPFKSDRDSTNLVLNHDINQQQYKHRIKFS